MSRILERLVVKDCIYPARRGPTVGISFKDQFAFQPSGSTTAALIQLLYTITTLLATHPFVIVYALDFSEAFDSVRHNTVIEKYSRIDIPDNIYNWILNFLKDHSHCTNFDDVISKFRTISASIIQGSGIGPASYVLTASDLHPVTQGNTMVKFADDTYLVVPAVNAHSCADEIEHVEKWSNDNNLSLNRKKSVEIVFVSPWSKRAVRIPDPALAGIERVDSIKALGVTISRRLSIAEHVDNLLAACSQTLFAMRTLKQHGLPTNALHAVYQATVVAKLTYASPAWWGFASQADKERLEAFLRRSNLLGFREQSAPTLACICDEAEERLFKKISSNPNHLLFHLLPPQRDTHYNLRTRSRHNMQLPPRSTALSDRNFISRMLFKNLNYSSASANI
jgi:hypothetical protein